MECTRYSTYVIVPGQAPLATLQSYHYRKSTDTRKVWNGTVFIVSHMPTPKSVSIIQLKENRRQLNSEAANQKLTQEDAAQDREEIAHVHRHDRQHAEKKKFKHGTRTKGRGGPTAGNQRRP
jgi:hypothetical protein